MTEDLPTDDRAAALDRLLREVHAQPWAFDFFALLRQVDALRPDAPRTGQARRPVQEALRLGQVPEMDFAPAPLAHLEQRETPAGEPLPPRLAVRFFGLMGPHGPMPLHITEYVRERARQHGDKTLTRFLDLFHHRLLSLFYRAWAQHQPTVHLDRPADDRYTAWLAAAAGLPLGGQGALPARALAYQAGLLSRRTRSIEGLCKVLRQYFGVPVALVPHVGEWLAVQPQDRSRLGHARNRPEHALGAAALGRDATAGSRVWDRQYRFRLVLGPLPLARYLAFVPGGAAFAELQDWVRLLAGTHLRWDLQLLLHPHERPAPRLGRQVRLGLTGWLGRRTAPEPAADPSTVSPPPDRQTLRLRPATSFLLQHPGALHA